MENKKENFLKRVCNKICNRNSVVDNCEDSNEENDIIEGDFLLNSRPIDDGECYKGYKKVDEK